MPIVLTNEEKLVVLRRRIEALRSSYAENVLTLELMNFSDVPSDDEQRAVLQRQQEQIERNMTWMAAQVEALQEARIDAAFDAPTT